MPLDQTEPTWLTQFPSITRGTGLLFVEAPEPKRFERIVLHDVTHQEFLSNAAQNRAIAMKWVPHAICSADQLAVSSSCGQACPDGRCIDHHGCMCHEGTCHAHAE